MKRTHYQQLVSQLRAGGVLLPGEHKSTVILSETKDPVVVQNTLPYTIFYGETIDEYGIPFDALKYYFTLSLIHRALEKDSINVQSTILLADVASLMNQSASQKTDAISDSLNKRTQVLTTIIQKFHLPCQIKLMSDVCKTDQYKLLRQRINEYIQTPNNYKKILPFIEQTVMMNRRTEEEKKKYAYALDAITTGLLFHRKIGPPREKFYDQAAAIIARDLSIPPYQTLYGSPAYPLGMPFTYFLTHPEIEKYGLTPYKAGSNRLKDNRIILEETSNDTSTRLIMDSFESLRSDTAHPVLDLIRIAHLGHACQSNDTPVSIIKPTDYCTLSEMKRNATLNVEDTQKALHSEPPSPYIQTPSVHTDPGGPCEPLSFRARSKPTQVRQLQNTGSGDPSDKDLREYSDKQLRSKRIKQKGSVKTKKFGLASIEKIRVYTPINYQPLLMRRGCVMAHLDFEQILEAMVSNQKFAIISGTNPSSSLHIGHIALFSMLTEFQKYDVDIHIPLTDDESYVDGKTKNVSDASSIAYRTILPSLIATGLRAQNTRVYIDSMYPLLQKYTLQISKFVSFSEVRSVFGSDSLTNIGQILYRGATQITEILLPQMPEFGGPKPTLVPVGADQHPYILLARDVAKRMGLIPPSEIVLTFLPSLKDPEKKMSGSKPDTAIYMTDTDDVVTKKINQAYTGSVSSLAGHQALGGVPEIDPVFQILRYLHPDDSVVVQTKDAYQSGMITSSELKKTTIQFLLGYLQGFRERSTSTLAVYDSYLLHTPPSIHTRESI